MAENENTENQVEETGEMSAAEPEAPVAPAAEEPAETEAEATESPEPAAEAPAAPAAEAPAAPAAEAPAAPAKPQPSRRHVPRKDRRKRPRPARERVEGQRKPITRLAKPDHERGRRQERRGVVVSSAMDKTIVVKVDMIKLHPRYKKVIRRSQKFHAHDEQNQANVGDVVRIVETRPLSKTKSWRLAEVVEVAK
jgi:small subunit ribosomal protein S17